MQAVERENSKKRHQLREGIGAPLLEKKPKKITLARLEGKLLEERLRDSFVHLHLPLREHVQERRFLCGEFSVGIIHAVAHCETVHE